MTDVLIVASSAVVRAGLASLLGAGPALQVVASVPSIAEAARLIDEHRADVLLIDLERADLPALPASRDSETVPVVLLMPEDVPEQAVEALRHGVRAVLPRDANPEEMEAAVLAASSGLIVLHPALAGALDAVPTIHPRPESLGSEALTPREVEVLAMLAEGEGNKQIAHRLGISEHTVKFHVGSILSKLGASSRTEAVTLGVRQGLIML